MHKRQFAKVTETPEKSLLAEKVVMVIGGDTAPVLQLILFLVQKGADVAFVSPPLTVQSKTTLRHCAETYGCRIIILETGEGQLRDTKLIVNLIATNLGSVDYVIDISADNPTWSQRPFRTTNSDKLYDNWDAFLTVFEIMKP
jgi:hypothetical protein